MQAVSSSVRRVLPFGRPRAEELFTPIAEGTPSSEANLFPIRGEAPPTPVRQVGPVSAGIQSLPINLHEISTSTQNVLVEIRICADDRGVRCQLESLAQADENVTLGQRWIPFSEGLKPIRMNYVAKIDVGPEYDIVDKEVLDAPLLSKRKFKQFLKGRLPPNCVNVFCSVTLVDLKVDLTYVTIFDEDDIGETDIDLSIKALKIRDCE